MLARVRSVCPHLRANIVFVGVAGGVHRRLMQVPLPVLVPLRRARACPNLSRCRLIHR